MQEAREAAEVLKKDNYTFDLAYTSVLKRAIRTLWTVLDGMDLMWIPVHRCWRPERKALRRAAGSQQSRDRGQVRRRPGEDLAPEL